MPAALADQLEQPSARPLIMLVRVEVFQQLVDPIRQQRHLHFRRAGVRLVDPVFLDFSTVVIVIGTPVYSLGQTLHSAPSGDPSRLPIGRIDAVPGV